MDEVRDEAGEWLEIEETPDPFTRSAGDESSEEIGESASVSPTAPSSSGLPHGSSGEVEDADALDSQGRRQPRSGTGETPVRSASGGADAGGRVQSGSAGAASISAGSAPPNAPEERDGEEGEGRRRPGGRKPGG